MPANLPGFYWDETRNRYFPISSKPKPPPTAAAQQMNADAILNKPPRRTFNPWRQNEARKLTSSHTEILRGHQCVSSGEDNATLV